MLHMGTFNFYQNCMRDLHCSETPLEQPVASNPPPPPPPGVKGGGDTFTQSAIIVA